MKTQTLGLRLVLIAGLVLGSVLLSSLTAMAWDCKPGDVWDTEHHECRRDLRIRIVDKNLNIDKNSNSNANTNTSTASSAATATGGAANGTNTSTNSLAATGNGANSNNTTNNVAAAGIPANTAYAPTALPTVPCFKGMGVGAQVAQAGFSFGGGKIDENCAILETARSFALHGSDVAYCKVMVTTKAARKAGVTFEDCMVLRTEPQPQAVQTPQEPAQQPQAAVPPQIIVPAPQVTINLPAASVSAPAAPPTIAAPAPATVIKPMIKHKRHANKPCPVQPEVSK
jgi:hypothetical protein